MHNVFTLMSRSCSVTVLPEGHVMNSSERLSRIDFRAEVTVYSPSCKLHSTTVMAFKQYTHIRVCQGLLHLVPQYSSCVTELLKSFDLAREYLFNQNALIIEFIYRNIVEILSNSIYPAERGHYRQGIPFL